MTLTVRFLHDQPNCAVVAALEAEVARCCEFQIVVGFVTLEGLKAVLPAIASQPTKLKSLVVGAGTRNAFDALSELLSCGVPNDRLGVHLGFSNGPSKSKGTGSFQRFRPLMHSKIYYFERSDGTAAALVGSHNMTGFALGGLNAEASIYVEGDINERVFQDIRSHCQLVQQQSVQFSTAMIAAYSWWTAQYVSGLASEIGSKEEGLEKKKTIVLVAQLPKGGQPKPNEVIYIELPKALGKVPSLKAQFHVYLFEHRPPSVDYALANPDKAKCVYWCELEGLENREGGRELLADWHFPDRSLPQLQATAKPFRPRPTSDDQQLRIRIERELSLRFDYLFDAESAGWEPELSEELQNMYETDQFLEDASSPPADLGRTQDWKLVVGLRPASQRRNDRTDKLQAAMRDLTPDSESYLLYSIGRKRR